ncbi:hypothetical protein KFL_003970130 [Klebsormidium nitens]|uniref:Uncharacterized protein n=1 Tax=Klebsormidium nitens TaxID=105231 RepID=A0A1Y1IH51_KLENI|nr:hypothetical protein KFL_003970130 [Klebsormidium nitens]|eukprot:GAQ88066.1 hypothetical protein KFL_003970130 [Klebsormidium nitens]
MGSDLCFPWESDLSASDASEGEDLEGVEYEPRSIDGSKSEESRRASSMTMILPAFRGRVSTELSTMKLLSTPGTRRTRPQCCPLAAYLPAAHHGE